MPYTKKGPFVNNVTPPGIDATLLNDAEDALVSPIGPSGYFSGSYYGAPGIPETAGGAMTEGLLFLQPVLVTAAITIIGMGINHYATVGSAGSVVRMGLYRDDGRDLLTRILDAGTVATDTAANRKEITGLSQAVARGLYWIGAVGQGAPATVPNVARTQAATNWLVNAVTPRGWNGNFSIHSRGFTRSGITGALPATLVPVRADFENLSDYTFVWFKV